MRTRIAGALVSFALALFMASPAYAQLDELNTVIGGTSATAASVSTARSMPVDLLVDADSYVPPFYRGRALPSAQTNLRLQAVASFKRADGTVVPASAIIYTWHQDDRVVGNVSGLGKSSVVLPSPTLYGASDIEVDARSSDGTLSGSASLVIPSTEPEVVLYEDNPLLGLTYYHAVAPSSALTDTEMTFAAVPYYAEASSANDPRLVYAWTVNGANVPSSTSDPSEITLNSMNSNGIAAVGLDLTHTSNFYMSSTGSWNIALGSQSSRGFGSASTGVKDPFSGKTQ